MKAVPNIQQDFDNYLFDSVNDIFGNCGKGNDWIKDPVRNKKNKYAVMREYRSIASEDLISNLSGRIHTHFGCVVITTTRMVSTKMTVSPDHPKYGARLETSIYLASSAIRQTQLRGERRRVYEMTQDLISCYVNNPFHIGGNRLSVVPEFSESDYTTDQIDIMRAQIILNVSRYI